MEIASEFHRWRRSRFEPCYSQNPLVNALALGIAEGRDFLASEGQAIP
jgi:hypothetical protein